MDKQKTAEVIAKFSHGLLKRTTDLVLFQFYFGLEIMVNSPTSRGAYSAFYAAQQDLKELNFSTIERAFFSLKKKGLVETIKEEVYYKPLITEAGIKRLKSIYPFYESRRVWDGRLYLVTYDVGEESKKDRERLRSHLLKIHCGKLQDSVYLTPYNPTEVLREFIEKANLNGEVLISNLGEDGHIGGEDLKELLTRIYQLEDLCERYSNFIESYRHRNKTDKAEMIFDFYSILADDPQLPFPLLPNDWPGKKAYQLLRRHLKTK
ncbi:MAG: PaaX family transcriptional regulator C-terminal domain-containing protein [Patescibacteria group bacterium]